MTTTRTSFCCNCNEPCAWPRTKSDMAVCDSAVCIAEITRVQTGMAAHREAMRSGRGSAPRGEYATLVAVTSRKAR